MTCQEGGITVRTLSTLVGIGLCVLGPRLRCGAGNGAESCHRVPPVSRRRRGGGAGAGAPAFPTLDGQHAAYLDKQLRESMSGKRKTHHGPPDRALKKQQISGIAAHFAGQTPARGDVGESSWRPAASCCTRKATAPPACRRASAVDLPNGTGHERCPGWPASVRPTSYSVTEFEERARAPTTGHTSCAPGRASHGRGIRAVAEYLAGL